MDKRNIEETKKALLNAAGKLMMECSDASEVTSRAITNEAGVNLAMINYCFGSREALLFEVFSGLQDEALKCSPEFKMILNDECSPKEKLAKVHFESMKIMLKHYKYVKALTKFILLNREISSKRGSLRFIMEHFQGRKTENECRLIAYELSSIHELAILRCDEIKEICGIDLRDDESLKKYIDAHINMFLGE